MNLLDLNFWAVGLLKQFDRFLVLPALLVKPGGWHGDVSLGSISVGLSWKYGLIDQSPSFKDYLLRRFLSGCPIGCLGRTLGLLLKGLGPKITLKFRIKNLILTLRGIYFLDLLRGIFLCRSL